MGQALSQFGRRWALRVVWELRVGPLNFRALQAACGNISPSVLQRRLHELRDQQIIEKIPRLGYRLISLEWNQCDIFGENGGGIDHDHPWS